MKIFINGEMQEVNNELSILSLLQNLNIESKVVAISLNGSIVNRTDWNSKIVEEDDSLEILQFMAGGSLSKRSF